MRPTANIDFRLGDSMDAMFDKWDTVLQKVADSHSSFLLFLSEELVHKLALDPSMESSRNTLAEGVFLWLDHLLTSPAWESHRPFLPQSYLLAVCTSQPTHWTKMLGKKLNLEQQETAAAVSAPQMTANPPPRKRAQTDSVGGFSKKLQEHGWGLAAQWDIRPLRVTSSN
jgi:ribosomal biogenesis protein LAS1